MSVGDLRRKTRPATTARADRVAPGHGNERHAALERGAGAAAVLRHGEVLSARLMPTAQLASVERMADAHAPTGAVIQLSSKGRKEDKKRPSPYRTTRSNNNNNSIDKDDDDDNNNNNSNNNNAMNDDGADRENVNVNPRGISDARTLSRRARLQEKLRQRRDRESSDNNNSNNNNNSRLSDDAMPPSGEEEEKGGGASAVSANASNSRKIYLRDRLRRAQIRAATRAKQNPPRIRHRAEEVAQLGMAERTLENPDKQPHSVSNPWGAATLGASPYDKDKPDNRHQPNVRLDMAFHRGYGGRKTESNYTGMSKVLDRSGKTARLLREMAAFHGSTGAVAPSRAMLDPATSASASLMATILSIESHMTRLADGGKYIRAALRRAIKMGRFSPTFTTEKGKAGLITAEDKGQAAFRDMMRDPTMNMQQHHVETLEEMSASSEDEVDTAQGASSSSANMNRRSPRFTKPVQGNNNNNNSNNNSNQTIMIDSDGDEIKETANSPVTGKRRHVAGRTATNRSAGSRGLTEQQAEEADDESDEMDDRIATDRAQRRKKHKRAREPGTSVDKSKDDKAKKGDKAGR